MNLCGSLPVARSITSSGTPYISISCGTIPPSSPSSQRNCGRVTPFCTSFGSSSSGHENSRGSVGRPKGLKSMIFHRPPGVQYASNTQSCRGNLSRTSRLKNATSESTMSARCSARKVAFLAPNRCRWHAAMRRRERTKARISRSGRRSYLQRGVRTGSGFRLHTDAFSCRNHKGRTLCFREGK